MNSLDFVDLPYNDFCVFVDKLVELGVDRDAE
jgi:hypothetical protein